VTATRVFSTLRLSDNHNHAFFLSWRMGVKAGLTRSSDPEITLPEISWGKLLKIRSGEQLVKHNDMDGSVKEQ